PAPLRLVRRRGGPLQRDAGRRRRTGRDAAGRTGPVRRAEGLHGLRDGWRAHRLVPERLVPAGALPAGVRDAARLGQGRERGAEAGRPAGEGAEIRGPARRIAGSAGVGDLGGAGPGADDSVLARKVWQHSSINTNVASAAKRSLSPQLTRARLYLSGIGGRRR